LSKYSEELHWEVLGFVRVQTGVAQSTRTCWRWKSPGRKWWWQLI